MTVQALAAQIRAQGGAWEIAGIDRALELAELLWDAGVKVWGPLEVVARTETVVTPGGWGGAGDAEVWVPAITEQVRRVRLRIGQVLVGFVGDYDNDGRRGANAARYLQDGTRLAWSARGDGNVSYVLTEFPVVKVLPVWSTSSDRARLVPVALVVAAAIGGALLWTAATTGGAAGAAAGAATTGTTAATAATAGAAVEAGFALEGLLLAGATPTAGAYGAGLSLTTAAELVGGGLLTAPGAALGATAGATAGAAAGATAGTTAGTAAGPMTVADYAGKVATGVGTNLIDAGVSAVIGTVLPGPSTPTPTTPAPGAGAGAGITTDLLIGGAAILVAIML